jgi:hypothetical protein
LSWGELRCSNLAAAGYATRVVRSVECVTLGVILFRYRFRARGLDDGTDRVFRCPLSGANRTCPTSQQQSARFARTGPSSWEECRYRTSSSKSCNETSSEFYQLSFRQHTPCRSQRPISVGLARRSRHAARIGHKSWEARQVIFWPPKSQRRTRHIAAGVTRPLVSACPIPGNRRYIVADLLRRACPQLVGGGKICLRQLRLSAPYAGREVAQNCTALHFFAAFFNY